MLYDILLNQWFYTFITSWIIFFLLVDLKSLKLNIWGGLFAAALELWQDSTATAVGMYYFPNAGITILNVPVFFTFGTAFTMGVLYLQYLPVNPKLQLIHMFVFIGGFLIFEYLVTMDGLLALPHWSHLGSFFDDIIIFGAFTWLKQFILCKPKSVG